MTISYKKGDVIVIPFPFIDSDLAKRRPALVLSAEKFNNGSNALVCGMVTSAQDKWPGDVRLRSWNQAGLKRECVFRLKLFTIEQNLVKETVGSLADSDMVQVNKILGEHLDLRG